MVINYKKNYFLLLKEQAEILPMNKKLKVTQSVFAEGLCALDSTENELGLSPSGQNQQFEGFKFIYTIKNHFYNIVNLT